MSLCTWHNPRHLYSFKKNDYGWYDVTQNIKWIEPRLSFRIFKYIISWSCPYAISILIKRTWYSTGWFTISLEKNK